MESKNTLECYICFDVPNKPVTTTCGHIFCWKCIQSWISSKDKLECPVCKNGITMDGIIPLYTGKNDTREVDDRPKAKRNAPGVNNNNTFVIIFIYLV
jgi:E3 ubiquitin-protein ligase RNF5